MQLRQSKISKSSVPSLVAQLSNIVEVMKGGGAMIQHCRSPDQ